MLKSPIKLGYAFIFMFKIGLDHGSIIETNLD